MARVPRPVIALGPSIASKTVRRSAGCGVAEDPRPVRKASLWPSSRTAPGGDPDCGRRFARLLYGVGRLLRNMEAWVRKRRRFPRACESPRPPSIPFAVTNWDIGPRSMPTMPGRRPQFDQYIRELALFGANSIEILAAPAPTTSAPAGT